MKAEAETVDKGAGRPRDRRIDAAILAATAELLVEVGYGALTMAAMDGIKNKIHPGDPMDKDLYDLPPEELKDIPTVCGSLREALTSLDQDRAFLKAGGVFTNDMIDAYIELKMQEVTRFRMTTHPVEYDMYYSL